MELHKRDQVLVFSAISVPLDYFTYFSLVLDTTLFPWLATLSHVRAYRGYGRDGSHSSVSVGAGFGVSFLVR